MKKITATPELSDVEMKRINNEDISDLSRFLTETMKWLNQKMISQWPLDGISSEKP